MSQMETDGPRAVRRVAIEALSYTSAAGTPSLTKGQDDVAQESMAHALSLVDAYATLAGIEYQTALSDLTEAARNLHDARNAALAFWRETCARLSCVDVYLNISTGDIDVVRTYAQKADISYGLACANLLEAHERHCPDHDEQDEQPEPAPTTHATPTPAPHSHPGRHGFDVRGHESAGLHEIGDLCVLLNLAVMTHPDMAGVKKVVVQPQDTRLDQIAGLDRTERLQAQAALGVTEELAGNHEVILQLLADTTGWAQNYVRDTVKELVTQYCTYDGFAKHEWGQIAGLEFDEGMLGRVGVNYHNIVAVGNALGLTAAETLVFLRQLVAIDKANVQRRLQPPG